MQLRAIPVSRNQQLKETIGFDINIHIYCIYLRSANIYPNFHIVVAKAVLGRSNEVCVALSQVTCRD